MSRKSKNAQIEERRKKVAANLLGGLTYRQMAETFGVSLGTIANDVRIVLGRWRREQVQNADEWTRLELERLNRLTNALWNNALDGKLAAVDRILKVMERRAKLLGLDAPVKQDLTSDGESLVPTDKLVAEIRAAQQLLEDDAQ